MIRSTLKRGLKKVANIARGPEPSAPAEPYTPPAAREAAPPPAPTPTVTSAPAEVAEPATAEPAASAESWDDAAGMPLTMENVQEILDEMVRPALQGDGGDISLMKIEDENIYVKLVGSCSTCPSSIATMKMGVEALLKEEFPSMKELIQLD